VNVQGEWKVCVFLYKKGAALCRQLKFPYIKHFSCGMLDLCCVVPTSCNSTYMNWCGTLIHCGFHSKLYPFSDRCARTFWSHCIYVPPDFLKDICIPLMLLHCSRKYAHVMAVWQLTSSVGCCKSFVGEIMHVFRPCDK
jgi:hypothetical protein